VTVVVTNEEMIPIGETARRAGVSAHTLRYYERQGLISAVERGLRGERRYAAGDLEWICFLKRLRATRMPIRDMARFAELRRGGDGTRSERAQLLDEHAARVRVQIGTLHGDLRAIAAKRAILESDGRAGGG
jgi:DNA-binding transcriptional MerR regulator